MNNANSYQRKVFGDTIDERDRIIRACQHAESPLAQNVARKLKKCCESPTMHANADDSNIKIVEQRCKSRICPRCTQFRTWRLIARMMPIVKTADSPRFLTLTVKHSQEDLISQIKHLTKSFAKLRKTKRWKANVDGGLYTIEVKWSPKTNAWHPHIHAIIDGRFYPHAHLKSAWQNITDGSSIVDIRAINSRRNAVTYVAKYAAKAAETKDIPAHRIPEWASALHGLRMAQTFGKMHNVKIERDDDSEPFPEHAAFIGPAIYDADQGNADAKKLVARIYELARRRVPDGDAAAAAEHAAELAKALDRVRAIERSHKESFHNDTASTRSVRSGKGRARDGPVRLWEEHGNRSALLGVQDT